MFKKLLLALGFAKAPAPVRSYLTVSSFVGALPALAWVLWRNRDRLRPLLQRASSRVDAVRARSHAGGQAATVS
jgi:hypothetical protein